MGLRPEDGADDRRAPARDRRRTGALLALTVVVFGLAALAAAGGSVHPFEPGEGGWRIDGDDRPRERDIASVPAEPGAEPDDAGVAGDFAAGAGELVAVVAITALLGLIGRSAYRYLRAMELTPPPAPETWDEVPADARTEVAEAAETAIGLARGGGTTNDVVIACWLALEEAADRAGIGRAPTETAAELTVRVLRRLDVPPDATGRLLALYRRARYSDHVLDDADRRAAVASLDAIRTSLGPVTSR